MAVKYIKQYSLPIVTMKKAVSRVMLILALCMSLIASAHAAVPTELDCTPYENSSIQICDTLDQVGTGMALLTYKVNLGLPSFLIGIAMVAIVIGLAYAVVFVITKSMAAIKVGGKFK